ncbi:MAG: sulfatase-like hydrolase/transferase, partial [Flavobacteriaceae bacterium]|nr:sulfatase-like hydrolase/transferase [Flavobacteriaceae bacterium]
TAQATLPRMLQSKGYYTAIIGKWHLGLGDGDVNWNETISPGPNELGFDYSYILAATQDRVPTVYIEDGNVVGLEEDDPIEVDYKTNFEGVPTALTHPELLEVMWDHGHNNSIVNGIPRIGFMKGGKNALWSDIDMADAFLNQAKTFITSHSKEPFFLFYPMQQPHVPRTPHPRFVGATDLGPRGDVIAEADWVIGELLAQLEIEGILENTLVIFTSDNGPVLNDGYVDQAVERNGDHTPWGPLRGGKYSLFEAGTHVPFVAYWKGKIQTGTSSSLISQLDLFSSLAAIVNSEERTADSHDLHQTLLGQSQVGRKDLIIEASGRTALRTEDWVYIPPYTGRRAVSRFTNIELGNSETPLLYHLKTDIGQQQNLATDSLSQLESMQKQYKTILGVE